MIRKVCVVACFVGYHLAGSIYHLFEQGNPSGCALTTIINCLANMFFIRYAFKKLTPFKLNVFNEHVKPKFYGDDNLVGLSKIIKQYLNMVTYRDCMAKLGVTYTSVDKTEIVKLTYAKNELSFLKNDIKYDSEFGWVALLELDTIYNIGRWSSSDPYIMEDQMQRVNDILQKIRPYGVS